MTNRQRLGGKKTAPFVDFQFQSFYKHTFVLNGEGAQAPERGDKVLN